MDSYFRLFEEKKISKWFAVCPPFNGLSGIIGQMIVKGYDSDCPLPLSLCK